MASLNLSQKIVKSRDGTDIFAEAIGDPSKPHVVFVHGYTANGTSFDPLWALPSLQQELYAIRYDTRGHGRSGKPETEEAYESRRYADDFQAVSEAFGLKNPVLAGWSLGATIAADLAAFQIPISGVVYISGLPYLGDILPIVATPLVLSFTRGISDVADAANGLQTRVDFCKSLVSPKRLPFVPFPDLCTWIGSATHLPPAISSLVLGRTQDPEPLKSAAKNGLPLLILYGDDDLQISGPAVVEQMQPLFRDLEVVCLDGVGHTPFYEETKKSYEAISRFVKRVYQAPK